MTYISKETALREYKEAKKNYLENMTTDKVNETIKITVEDAERLALMPDGDYQEEFEKYLIKNDIALDCWEYSDLSDFFVSLGFEPV